MGSSKNMEVEIVEKEYDGYDCLRFELFETLIPAMLYKGTEKEKNEFFGYLKQDVKYLSRICTRHYVRRMVCCIHMKRQNLK